MLGILRRVRVERFWFVETADLLLAVVAADLLRVEPEDLPLPAEADLLLLLLVLLGFLARELELELDLPFVLDVLAVFA